MISFQVDGVPAPKGSLRGWVNKRTGRVAITHDNKRTKPWEQQLVWAAREALDGKSFDGPVSVIVQFRFRRPKSHYRRDGRLNDSAWTKPVVKPDVDKCLRLVLDSLTIAGAWRDDSQVTTVRAEKWYSDRPGVTVEIEGDG